jgi:hypothetical protein
MNEREEFQLIEQEYFKLLKEQARNNMRFINSLKENKMSEVEQFEDVSGNGKLVKTAQLAIGDSFRGKLVSLQVSTRYPDRQNLCMEDTEGEPFLVFTSGSLSYAVKDGKLEVGQTYRITRLENKPSKGGTTRTQFKIERLKSNGSVASPGVNTIKPSGK